MPQIEAGMRLRIAEFLPSAIQAALASYELFLVSGASDDAADFKKHHDACKIAIAHIELLIKLAQWADLPSDEDINEAENTVLKTAIDLAMKELKENEPRKV